MKQYRDEVGGLKMYQAREPSLAWGEGVKKPKVTQNVLNILVLKSDVILKIGKCLYRYHSDQDRVSRSTLETARLKITAVISR